MWPGPLPGPLWIRLAGEEGELEGRVWAWCRPFPCCSRVAGVHEAWTRPGDVGGSRWAFVRTRYHGLLRLAPILRVSLARVGQVDVVPVGVSDRQALPGCVAQPRAVGLYKGVPLGWVGSPGVVAVYGRVRSRWCDVHQPAPWWEKASSQPSCCLLPCAWPARASCRACVAVRRRCRSCGRVRLRVLGVSHALHKGAAEGTEDFMHKGPACRQGPCRSADGGLPLFAEHQRPDLVDRCVGQHSRGHWLGRGPRVYGWPLCPAPRGSVTRERRVRSDAGSGCGAAPFSCGRRVAGVWEVRPFSGGCGRRSLRLHSCRTPWAAKASLYLLGARCTFRVV